MAEIFPGFVFLGKQQYGQWNNDPLSGFQCPSKSDWVALENISGN
jgi:hypothetical protein